MADEDRDVWQTPRNAGVGMLADALTAGKSGLNYIDLIKLLSPPVPTYANRDNIPYQIPDPKNPMLGLGDATLGSAPEEIERWSQGNSPFYEQHYGFNPTIRPERRMNMLDIALLPEVKLLAAAKLMGRGATKAAEKVGIKSLLKDSAPAVEATDEGRRAALKGIVALPAAAATAHFVPKLLEKSVEKTVTPGSMFDYIDALNKAHHDTYRTADALLHHVANSPESGYFHEGEFLEDSKNKILAEKLDRVNKDPRFTDEQRKAWKEYQTIEEKVNSAPYDHETGTYEDSSIPVEHEKAARNIGWRPPEEIYDTVMENGVYQDPFTGLTYKRAGDRVLVEHHSVIKGNKPFATKLLDKESVENWAEHHSSHFGTGDDMTRWYGEGYDSKLVPHKEKLPTIRNFHLDNFIKEHPTLYKALSSFEGSGAIYKSGGSIENTTHNRKLI
jgi:hypothetical protein